MSISFKSILIIFCTALVFAACIAEPDYSNVPSISFKNIKNLPNITGQADSVMITLQFQDGDGDLGLDQGDTIPPYSIFNTDGTPNRFHFNYFVEVQRQNTNGEFEPIIFANQTFTLNSRFPRLNTLDKETALEGDLRFTFNVFKTAFSPIKDGDVLRFEVQIADRALNESNVVITEPITMGLYE